MKLKLKYFQKIKLNSKFLQKYILDDISKFYSNFCVKFFKLC